jgi:protein TIF31
MEVKQVDIEHNFSEWLNFSGYNPVPYYRKLMGDYYYIYFKSPEELDYHLTGHAEGFFLNQSSNSHFNPNISTKHSKIFISLLDLLYCISPKFKEIFKNCLNKIKNN